jgi:hypothetical protein
MFRKVAPTPIFQGSVLPFNPPQFQQLNFPEWPQFCDHSVTSADVRLWVNGLELRTLLPLSGGPILTVTLLLSDGTAKWRTREREEPEAN